MEEAQTEMGMTNKTAHQMDFSIRFAAVKLKMTAVLLNFPTTDS